jgi:hypothetical protein
VATATFLRLDGGKWGLRVVGDTSPGAVVTVTRRDGEAKQLTVGKILSKKGDVWFCTIATEEEKIKLAARPKQSFDSKLNTTKPSVQISVEDDGSPPFDPPYKYVKV